MNTLRLTRNLVVCAIGASLLCCKHEEIILHMDIAGSVTDASTGIPIADAFIRLLPPDDTTTTIQDGTFIFKNLAPGNYEIQASKKGYSKGSEYISTLSEKTYKVDFILDGAPIPDVNKTYLDFGFDSTSLQFTVSNSGQGKLTYLFLPSQEEWISVHPSSGEVSNETDTIVVTINKSGLAEKTYKESIQMISVLGKDIQIDTIKIYLNGIMDKSLNYYYKTVRIGSQIWMAENLNVGNMIISAYPQKDNQVIEKYCYNNNPENCKIYGGLYQWAEMMKYHSSDDGITGTTQGICPLGWHIPTKQESAALIFYLGGTNSAGMKLKDANPIYWPLAGSGEATNESGFSAIPTSCFDSQSNQFFGRNEQDDWWTSTASASDLAAWYFGIWYENDWTPLDTAGVIKTCGMSVRCIKDEHSR